MAHLKNTHFFLNGKWGKGSRQCENYEKKKARWDSEDAELA